MKKITLVLIALFIGATVYAQTITQSIITTAELDVAAVGGSATGWTPVPATLIISIAGFPANQTFQFFNQFKIANAAGAQWGGGSFMITTDATGAGSNNMWMPGFFGGATFQKTEPLAFWNTNTTVNGGPLAVNQTFPITFNPPLSVDGFSLNTNVSVYPNPTADSIKIDTNQAFNAVNIFDITGRVVKTFDNEKTLNVSSLQAGMYFMKTDTGLSAKFVKK